MPHFDKHFSYAEANALIPRIQTIFNEIRRLIDEVRKNQGVIFPPPEQLSPGRINGSHKKPRRTQEEITKTINDLITEITDQGIVIQDVYRGLVDFPTFINGDEVFFCYELSDGDSILFYHPLETGYAGRQPIPPDIEK